MFPLEVDSIPFDHTALSSTTGQYFGKKMDARVRLSDPEYYVCSFLAV